MKPGGWEMLRLSTGNWLAFYDSEDEARQALAAILAERPEDADDVVIGPMKPDTQLLAPFARAEQARLWFLRLLVRRGKVGS